MTKHNLTPVEFELMEILWKIGKGTVHDVLENLPGNRNLAYTSVSTILRILEQKKILTTKKNGRQHIYLPVLNKQTFATHSVKKIVREVFSGNSVELVAYLVNENTITESEISEIQKLLSKKKKELVQ
jgi:predicted transcriptional regulator